MCPAASGESPKAVVLLSGGMDSAVTLAIAQSRGFVCHALSIDYGQRHIAELVAAEQMAESAASHRVVTVDLRAIGGSALTADSVAVPESGGSGIPVTYVPARNTIMLAIALGHAEVLGASAIFCGVNAVDFSGYPDCRPVFIEAFQALANVATKAGADAHEISIEAPLLAMSKADIVRQAARLGVSLGGTVSCYRADGEGRACGTCDACELRARGFAEAGIADPTRYA